MCQGYLDIVRWLCESGGATSELDNTRGVDIGSKGGWTPLSTFKNLRLILFFNRLLLTVNAASKGHLPIVLYLLTKQSANPLIRNNWGETAYDVAAAVFEVWICEVWHSENQRDSRGLKTPHRFSKKPKQNGGAAPLYHTIHYPFT